VGAFGSGPPWLKWVVLVLLTFKLAITASNAWLYPHGGYDARMHIARLRTGGLGLEGRAYNSPLYYIPALLRTRSFDYEQGRKIPDYELFGLMRWTNLAWLVLFYGCWVFGAFPRLFRDWRRRLAATLLLLGLPGYQKMAAFTHPDNALAALSALIFAVWLGMRERKVGLIPGSAADAVPPDWRDILWLAIIGGLAANTRPFGILPAAAAWMVAILHGAKGRRWVDWGTFRRALAVTIIIGGFVLAWPISQLVRQGHLEDPYNHAYIDQYVARRPDFDFVAYYSSFYFGDLLEIPNRTVRKLDRESPDKYHNRYGNSFWTLLYSEFWGDHWVYFSGANYREKKVWPKRILFLYALPLSFLAPLLWFRASWRIVRKAMRRIWACEQGIYILTFFALGWFLFVYWQATGGLVPGKNSSVKFIYNAYHFPFGIALMFMQGMPRWSLTSFQVYLFGLFVIAIPVAVFVP
jgi:hypothetical protein